MNFAKHNRLDAFLEYVIQRSQILILSTNNLQILLNKMLFMIRDGNTKKTVLNGFVLNRFFCFVFFVDRFFCFLLFF